MAQLARRVTIVGATIAVALARLADILAILRPGSAASWSCPHAAIGRPTRSVVGAADAITAARISRTGEPIGSSAVPLTTAAHIQGPACHSVTTPTKSCGVATQLATAGGASPQIEPKPSRTQPPIRTGLAARRTAKTKTQPHACDDQSSSQDFHAITRLSAARRLKPPVRARTSETARLRRLHQVVEAAGTNS